MSQILYTDAFPRGDEVVGEACKHSPGEAWGHSFCRDTVTFMYDNDNKEESLDPLKYLVTTQNLGKRSTKTTEGEPRLEDLWPIEEYKQFGRTVEGTHGTRFVPTVLLVCFRQKARSVFGAVKEVYDTFLYQRQTQVETMVVNLVHVARAVLLKDERPKWLQRIIS